MMIIKSNRDGNEFAWIQFKRLIFSYLKRTFFGVYLNFIERLRLAVYLPIESDKMKRRDEQVLLRMFCRKSKRSRNIMKITFPLEFLQIEFDDANLEIPWKFCLSLYLISFSFFLSCFLPFILFSAFMWFSRKLCLKFFTQFTLCYLKDILWDKDNWTEVENDICNRSVLSNLIHHSTTSVLYTYLFIASKCTKDIKTPQINRRMQL